MPSSSSNCSSCSSSRNFWVRSCKNRRKVTHHAIAVDAPVCNVATLSLQCTSVKRLALEYLLLKRKQTMLLLLVILKVACSAIAAPSINLPINSQVPPVAIIDQAYKFVFSASTFTSTAGHIDYALGDCPPWLQLDGLSRTFYGTPNSSGILPGQVASFVVDLIATDGAGSIRCRLLL